MAPFGFLRGHQLRRTPLSLAVPLDGTEHEMGLRQLEKYSRRRLSVRKRYRRYKGPFIEYLTVEDLKKGVKDWREFLHTRNARQDSYSVPGSLDALMERLEENIVYYLPNYLQVMMAIVILMYVLNYSLPYWFSDELGVFHGAIAGSVLAGYAYMNDKELPNHRKEQLLQVKAILIPALLAWCAFLTPMATIVSKGTLLGTFVVLVHGTLHRSPSELRYSEKKGVVRWVQRDQAPPEGLQPLLRDMMNHLGEWCIDARSWCRWRLFEGREYLVKKKWGLWNALKTGLRRKKIL